MKSTSRLKVLRKLHADRSGSVFIWVTAMVFVIFGLLALGIDGARYINLNSNLQHIADAAALSGAKSLDGSDQAIEKARVAAQTYLTNNLPGRWSDIASTEASQIATVKFTKTLGGAALADDKDEDAVYIEVTTISRGINTTFAKIFGASTAYTTASATARVMYSVCQPIQAFMCNPFENDVSNTNPGSSMNWIDKAIPGQMVFLAGGTSAQGNWGLLDPTPGGGGSISALNPYWATNTLGSCQSRTIADLSTASEVMPGNNAQHAANGMNVRFDKPYSSGYKAAPITIDGWKNGPGNGNCNNPNSENSTPSGAFAQTNVDPAKYKSYCESNLNRSCPLPRDRNLVLPGASWSNPDLPPMGTGPVMDDLKAYWKNHHGTSVSYPQVGGEDAKTRYDLYKAEVAARVAGTANFFTANTSGENVGPVCVPEAVGDVSRRLINVAVVDCDYWGIKGGSEDLPIISVTARFFMTEPATDTWTDPSINPSISGRIYAEYVDSATVNQEGGSVFQIVELVK